jgi:hypothetical protein
MNKTIISAISVFVLGCSLLLSSSAAITSNSIISASGVVQNYSPQLPNTPIKVATYAYGRWYLTEQEITLIANNLALLNCGGNWEMGLADLENLETRNPDIIIGGYKNLIGMYDWLEDWQTVNSNEEWFVHDTDGNRVIHQSFGWYLMDIGNPGWRQHYVSHVNSKIDNTPYDAVFADDVWSGLASDRWTCDPSKIKASDVDRWHSDTIGMLQYVKANLLPSKLLIINSDNWGSDYLEVVDGIAREGFAHAEWETPLQHSFSMQHLDAFLRDSSTGKHIWAISGTQILPETSITEIEEVVKFCYASFLCALNGSNTYLSFNNFGSERDWSDIYFSIFNTYIGQPSGGYYTSQNILMRNYTAGKVLLNPSDTPRTINLQTPYRTLDGNTVTSVYMDPWTGEILLPP